MTTLDLSQSANAAPTATTQSRPWLLTVEQLAYLALGLLSLIAHLWALGDRALHHDETLHATYSWFLFVGRGYIHDPLLHGPLLYYLGALGYFLFGDNDFSARLMPALAGTALTLTPYLLRRELGRPAALIAAVYLLISPVALYVGRFFRHDIYSVLLEMLVFAAIVRYLATRQRGWLLLGAASFGLMFVNQETSYLFLLIMLAPLAVAFLWQIYKPGIALVVALGFAVAALIFVLPAKALVDGAHHAIRDPATGAMQIDRPGWFGLPPLPTDDNGYALIIRNRADNAGGQDLFTNLGRYLADLFQFVLHPAVVLASGLILACLAALVYLIWQRPAANGQTPWQAALERHDPAATAFAGLGLGRRWLTALLIFGAIYLVFFTAFFTNLIGAISGVTGSLLYWLAQHNVERGGQPGHYYLFLLALYEPLLMIFGSLGLILVGRALFRWLRTQHSFDPAPQPAFAILFMAWWAVAALGIYTWAGEKMPWLTIHISVPMTLLAAWAAQSLIWRSQPDPDGQLPALSIPRSAWVIYAALFTAISGLSFVLLNAVVGFGNQAMIAPWVVPAASLILLTLLTLGATLRWDNRTAIALLVVCLGVALSLFTVRSSLRLAFVNGDVPREPMVYTQTSPDVMRVVRRLEDASIIRGRGLAMPIIYDNETVWGWYLRDFTNAQRISGTISTSPGPEVMAVLLLQENVPFGALNDGPLRGFVVQRYPLRWWLPEDQIYRLSANWRDVPLEQTSLLGQLLRNPLDRGVGERWWRFLIFRQLPHPLGSTDFVIAVRPELANQIGVGLGGSVRGERP
ncbi:MAG: flippase activity-associated protein Agl23 [Oscillochloridaceae bacterium umkhey_bin13]